MNTKYYFYILKCNNGNKYYGHTNNLTKRLIDHSKGRVQFTKNKRPVKLVYYKEFNSCSEAFNLEMQFKNGKTRKESIQKLIDSFPMQNVKGLIRRRPSAYNLRSSDDVSESVNCLLIKVKDK